MDYRIFPPDGIVETTVALPASKSIAARAMILDAVAGKNVAPDPTCADTSVLAAALTGGLKGTVDTGASGAAMRFVCALAAATEGADCILTGTDRMKERPIAFLVDALRLMGADIKYVEKEGFPPLEIHGRKLAGGNIEIDASVSSQFISAIMMVTPLMASPVTMSLRGTVGSFPYIGMTAAMMRNRGVEAEVEPTMVHVPNTPYSAPAVDDSEADWSAATFWYEIAALTAGWVTITNLKEKSIQGDAAVAGLFEKLGVVTEWSDEGAELSASPELFNGLNADMSDMPDAVPALAVTACMVGVPFRFSGVGALRHKESDRLAALVAELRKLGFILDIEQYGTMLVWEGGRVPVTEVPVFDTYSDHRMAMALAPVAVFVPGIVVKDAEVADKSYPGFWNHLREAGFTLLDPSEPIPAPADNEQ